MAWIGWVAGLSGHLRMAGVVWRCSPSTHCRVLVHVADDAAAQAPAPRRRTRPAPGLLKLAGFHRALFDFR